MELTGLKILITGAAGFIGSHLADRLAERNDLVLVDDFSVGRRENLAALAPRSNVRILEADVRDGERMREAMQGIEVVFHLAISCLRTSLGDPRLSHEVNAGGTLTTCLAARDRGVERFIYVSSSEVYGSARTVPMSESHPTLPTTTYGASKLAGELYSLAIWQTDGLPVSVVRPFNTYGPREPHRGSRAEVIPRFILRLAAGLPPVIYGDGTQTRDFTYVDDTVEGIVRAGACDELVGDAVNIARGREVSIAEIASRLSELVGGGKTEPAMRAGARPADVTRHLADIRKAERLFGFSPTVSIDDGLERTVEWFRGLAGSAPADVQAAGEPNW